MLFITHNFGPDTTWHTGDTFKLAPSEVKEIQADGDELAYILNNFKNISYTNKRVQRWYGDTAKFIVGNL